MAQIKKAHLDRMEDFKQLYKAVYGINPEITHDGKFYRSPHLPMAMNPAALVKHMRYLQAKVPENVVLGGGVDPQPENTNADTTLG